MLLLPESHHRNGNALKKKKKGGRIGISREIKEEHLWRGNPPEGINRDTTFGGERAHGMSWVVIQKGNTGELGGGEPQALKEGSLKAVVLILGGTRIRIGPSHRLVGG